MHEGDALLIEKLSEVDFAKPYDRKTPLTAADLLNDRVLPFYEEHCAIPLQRAAQTRQIRNQLRK